MDSIVVAEFQASFLGICYSIPFQSFSYFFWVKFQYIYIFLPFLVLLWISISLFQVHKSWVFGGNVFGWLVFSFSTPMAMDSSFEGTHLFSYISLFYICIFLLFCFNIFWVLILKKFGILEVLNIWISGLFLIFLMAMKVVKILYFAGFETCMVVRFQEHCCFLWFLMFWFD